MKNPYIELIGAALAFVLLLVYAGVMTYMNLEIIHSGGTTVTFPRLLPAAAVVGGIVSALAVAKLAITTPGRTPARLRSTTSNDGKQAKTVTVLIWLYLGAWVFVGLMSFVVGAMVFPDANQAIGDIGWNWWGLAAGAVSAYFGITPEKPIG